MMQKLSDMQNKVSYETDAPKPAGATPTMAPDVPEYVDVETVQTDNEMDRETMAALGASVRSGRVTVPPLCLGHLSLLEVFVPSIFTEQRVTCGEVQMALYILHAGQRMLTDAHAAILAREDLDEMVSLSFTGDDSMRVYLDARAKAARGMAGLRARVALWGKDLPDFAPDRVVADIRRCIDEHTYAFQMLPRKGGAEKKTAESSTRSFSAWSPLRWLASATKRLTRFCGARLLRASGI